MCMMAKPTAPRPPLSLGLALLITAALGVLIALALLVVTGVGILLLGGQRLNALSKIAQTTPAALASQAVAGWLQTPAQTEGRKNILILGLDSLATRGDSPVLTDSIIVA